jgi:small-conductance mechanosensitive channel
LIILQSLGISIAPILTALGVGGLAVALALQETLSNFFSGLYIIASRQIKPGDYVKLATGEEGYIVDVTWRNTTVQNLLNNMIIVPNSKLASVNITNFNQPVKEITITLDLGVSLDSDLTKVERVTVEVAREVMKEVVGGVVEFEPFVRFNSVADYSLRFTVIIRAQEFKDQFLLKHELIKRLFQRYHKEGIAFPYPVREVFFKNQG